MKRSVPHLLLAALLAVSSVGLAASPASADPPPWSAAYHKKYKQKHDHNHTGEYCTHQSHYPDGYRYNREYDRRVYRRPAPVYQSRRTYGGYDPIIYERCGHVLNRVQKARTGLARWEGTGRHAKAVRAWREYIRTAPRRVEQCRVAALQNQRYAHSTGWYDEDAYYQDEYFPGYGASFDLKTQWPAILGGLLGQYSQSR
ncbi:MAG TPA: hypothetical protein VGB18_00770 [Candidatus Thermoplasmatota archaeon]